MEALDSCGNECPGCLTHIIRILPYPQFFTCGCAICPNCNAEIQQCPTHSADLYMAQSPQFSAKLQEIAQLYQLYEESYTDDRSALDGLVLQVRNYVRQSGVQVEYVACGYCGQRVTPKGQTHCYSCSNPLVRQTWQCPNCYEYSEEGRCWKCERQRYQPPQPAYQNYAQPVLPSAGTQVYQPAARVNVRQSEPISSDVDWVCQKCNRKNYKTTINCRVCNNPKSVSTASPQTNLTPNLPTWQCPTCYEYTSEGRCRKCEALRYQPTQPAVPALNQNWICRNCQTYNYQSSAKCLKCSFPKEIPARVNIAPQAVYRNSRR